MRSMASAVDHDEVIGWVDISGSIIWLHSSKELGTDQAQNIADPEAFHFFLYLLRFYDIPLAISFLCTCVPVLTMELPGLLGLTGECCQTKGRH